MKKLIRIGVLLFSVFVLESVQAQGVVVNPSVHRTEISKNVLRAIFGMRLRKWPNGQAITVFVLPDQDRLHGRFSKTILNIFPYQLRRAWDRQVFSGTGQSPQEVASKQEMEEMIAKTPGGIGYLATEDLDEARESPRLEVLNVH